MCEKAQRNERAQRTNQARQVCPRGLPSSARGLALAVLTPP